MEEEPKESQAPAGGEARVERAKRNLRLAKLGVVVLALVVGLERAREGDPRLLYAAGALLAWLSLSEFLLQRRAG